MTEPTITDTVRQTLDEFGGEADKWGTLATETLEAPDQSQTPAEIAVSLPNAPGGAAFVKPLPEPVAPDTTFNDPDVPERHVVAPVLPFEAPSSPDEDVTFDWVTGVTEPGGKPSLPTYTAPTVTVPEIGVAPTIEAPPDVVLSSVTPPTFGGLTLPSMAISINPATLPSLENQFHYAEDPYAPEVMNEVLTQVRSVLGGRTVTPAWVWDGFWSRAAGNLKRQEAAEILEARFEHAALGHDLPGVSLLAREAVARQKAREAINDLTRENTLQQAVQYREDFWKAMETGMACETLLVQASGQRFERLLKAAAEANNAGIAVYNAALEAYKITEIMAKDLLVKLKDLELRGALSELQVFELELKAAGFQLDFDKNQVELYKAQWSGQETKAKAYAAYADAIKAYVDGQSAAVEAFKAQVESNNVILQGWATEWDVYVKRLEPSRLKIQAHQARNGLFQNRVQYFQARGINETSRLNADVELAKLGIADAQQELDRFKTLWSGIQVKLEALTKVFATEAQVFSAKSQAEAARTGSLVDLYRAEISKAQLALTAKTESAKLRLNYWQVDMDAWSKWQGALAGVYGQLGAAAYAAANISMTAGSHVGYSYGRSYSESLGRDYSVSVSAAVDTASGLDMSSPSIPTGRV